LTEITSIGILAHPLRPESYPIAGKIKRALQQRGLKTWLHTTWEETDVQTQVDQTDMVVAIGGDGAMLRAARACAPFGVPVLGINMGLLGFLTEIARPEDWEIGLNKVLAGDYWIEQRTMIRATVLENGVEIANGDALNDVVISGDRFGRMVRLETFIDNDWITSYNADALVVATATGSTAYALSCGGPILPPELTNILFIPSAPHLSMDRPIVLEKGAQVEVKPSTNNRHMVIVSVDGTLLREVPSDGGRIQVKASDHIARFIRLRGRNYFYRSLLDRLEPRVQRTREEQ
jgi:NAD+ kinase